MVQRMCLVTLLAHYLPFSMTNGNELYGLYSYRNSDPSYPVGVCGLSNLGNTCFMNSAIQCIASVAPLRNYFIADRFEDHINSENKLGSGGNIARAFARLMRQMWSERNRGGSCVPRELKVIGFYSSPFTL